MSKREHGELNCCCGRERCLSGSIKRSRLARKKKHLYLVLDDWEKGVSIHKIDVHDLDTDLEEEEPRVGFPEPAILWLAAPVRSHYMNFNALGSKLFVATNPRCGGTATFVYDAETAALTIGPSPPAPLLGGINISVAAGDVLYALNSHHGGQQHPFEAMSWASTARGIDEDWSPQPGMDWSWKSVPSPPPFAKDDIITSYALHPDGQTIFMSAHDSYYQRRAKGTFSFNTKSCVWKCHGECALRFRGKGYFDDELDAWVGLHEDGYICACEVPSRSSTSWQPGWKMVREKLFLKTPERRLIATARANLIYMGSSNFCLVECAVREGVEYKHAFGDGDGCVLHMMSTFGLKYNTRGELQTKHHRTHSFAVCKDLFG